MVLDPKHFDDMDDFCDFDDKLDSSSDSDMGDMGDGGPNQALSWRRVIIERAANNVKKAQEQKADLKSAYKKGALIFDEQANKFGRVLESRPGFLNVNLLGGGNIVRHDIKPLEFVRDKRHKLTLPEIAHTLGLTEVEVLILLNQIEAEGERTAAVPTPSSSMKQVKTTLVKTPIVTKPVKAKVELHKKKPEVKIATAESKVPKTSTKLVSKKTIVAKKAIAPSVDSVSFTKLLPKGATTDPVVDPNGYIQQNFLLMSNRELANATGLSEHTVRRKLGEWNLKRKDFVNKA